ncbi:hypothetical protein C7974DRAFT_379510 [Boeremia exigua]|uniref:uncharacterized protein n=1 Tax=Boeremia exigua TaxID=749465 RepID=UPI001E8E0879|nr:uncharacterized protein C7974DRAFT_379510 [Boeremia exigua]KAH6616639.1 hypothetical protein C7974DRAFT_379510 [Boeremia exigua]
MALRQVYDCFDTDGHGHFDSVDALFDRGVWIGYLAENSLTRYRGLPSYRELESNHKNLVLPFPTPIAHSSCSDREAACRGCFGDESRVLQLHEIRFGSHSMVVAMPLRGADDAGLFCIMLPQPLDRSIKALEMFRPFEHRLEHKDHKLFANSYMLLAIRDGKNNGGVLHTIRDTLDPTELARTATRLERLRSDAGAKEYRYEEVTVGNNMQPGWVSKTAKRKQQRASDSHNSTKRSRPENNGMQSGDGISQTLSAHNSFQRAEVWQQSPMLPSDASQRVPVRAPISQATNPSALDLTDEQLRRIHFVWKVYFEGMEYEVRRSLNNTSTFRGLLDSFREEAEVIPSASRQMKAGLWAVKYRLPDGTGKAVLVKPSGPHSELSLEGLLRHLAERPVWKEDSDLIVEIELGAMLSNSED